MDVIVSADFVVITVVIVVDKGIKKILGFLKLEVLQNYTITKQIGFYK